MQEITYIKDEFSYDDESEDAMPESQFNPLGMSKSIILRLTDACACEYTKCT